MAENVRVTQAHALVEAKISSGLVRVTQAHALVEANISSGLVRVTQAHALVEIQAPHPVKVPPSGGAAQSTRGEAVRTATVSQPASSIAGLGDVVNRAAATPPERRSITGAGYMQTRVYVGPAAITDFDWSGITAGSAYSKPSGTTLAANLASGATTMDVADASTWPSSGGAWVGPNASGESWEYVSYTGKTGNTLTGLTRETVDSEQTGAHTSGAQVLFWRELDTAEGVLDLDEQMPDALQAVSWSATLRGVLAPERSFRPGHLVLVEVRELNSGGTGFDPWEVLLLGLVKAARIEDDADRLASWTLEIGDVSVLLDQIEQDGLIVGDENLAEGGNATASSVLTAGYKETGAGEFTESNPDLSASKAVDGSMSTLWMSERYVGEDNPLPSVSYINAHPMAIADIRGVTQFHITKYTGQTDGYRWVELTAFDAANLGDCWLLVGFEHFVNLQTGAVGPSLSAGEQAILCENPTLFRQENPETDGQVLDLADYHRYNFNNRKYDIDLTGATGGTFTLTVGANTTAPIAYNATAADVESALQALASVGEFVRCSGGPLPSATVRVMFVLDLGREWGPTMTANFSGVTGGTPTLTLVSSGGFPFWEANSAADIFDYADPSGGIMLFFYGPGNAWQSQVVWGGESPFTTLSVPWTGSALPALGTGETARMIYDAGGASSPTTYDYWEVGNVATPGYVVESGDFEWLQVELPRMGLTLTNNITAGAPGSGGELAISDAAGPSVDGLPSSGVVQVGSEQIAYTGKKSDNSAITGITRGYGGTTAAAHSAGDTVYYVDGGVATDALPVKSFVVKRPGGGLMVLEDFTIRLSRLTTARTPDDTGYTADYHATQAVTGNALDEYTWTPASPERSRWLLLEVSKMGTQPARVRVNEITALVDESVYASGGRISASPPATVVDAILTNAGLPAGVISATPGALNVDGLRVAPGSAWRAVLDLADMLKVRVTIGRDSKIAIVDDPYWKDAAFAPTATYTWGRADLGDWQAMKRAARSVGQVRLWWRTHDDQTAQQEDYPSTQDAWGNQVVIGNQVAPYVLDDATEAALVAKKYYWLMRRPYSLVVEYADVGRSLRPGSVAQVTWDVASEGAALVRSYMIMQATHRYADFAWDTSLELVQLSREDER